jgi:hypothetical protein
MAINSPLDFANIWRWWSASVPGGLDHTAGDVTAVYEQATGLEAQHWMPNDGSGRRCDNLRYGDLTVNGLPVISATTGSIAAPKDTSLSPESSSSTNIFFAVSLPGRFGTICNQIYQNPPDPDLPNIFGVIVPDYGDQVTVVTSQGTLEALFSPPSYGLNWIIHVRLSEGTLQIYVYDMANALVGSHITNAVENDAKYVGPFRTRRLKFLEGNTAATIKFMEAIVLGAMDGPTDVQDMLDWIAVTWGELAPPPHTGSHPVTDISQAADPNCIYYGQVPAIQIGNKISYKTLTETNGWGVSIDAQGYPIIDSGGQVGSDSFLFNISRDSGSTWTPTPPTSDSWLFAIQPTLSTPTVSGETPSGATIGITTNATNGRLYAAARTAAQGGAYTDGDQEAIRDGTVGVDCAWKGNVVPIVGANTFDVTGLDSNAEYFYGFAQDASAV